MRPIPRSLLIHTATLEKAEKDVYGDAAYTTLAELRRVRVEPMVKQVLTTTDTQAQLSAVLLMDARSSTPPPETLDIAAGMYVTWAGIRHRVETVERMHDGRKFHHLEVGLSG